MAGGDAQKSQQEELVEDFRRMDLIEIKKDKPRDPEFDMKLMARSYPGLFDSILYKMNRTQLYTAIGTSHLMADSVEWMMDKKTLSPFADVVVKIHKRTWDFGFNKLHFYCYSRKMTEDHANYGKVCHVSKDKSRTNLWIRKDDVSHTLRHFQPKEFNINFDYFEKKPEFGIPPFMRSDYTYQENHEAFLRSLQPRQGVKTTIKYGTDVAVLLDILKPAELVLVEPFVIDSREFFSQAEFKPVKILRVFDYKTDDIFSGNDQNIHLGAFYEQLIEFEFFGDLSSMPSADINQFLKVWVSGKGGLIKFCMTTRSIVDSSMLFDILYGVKNTPVTFNQLPPMMKDTIREELKSVDYKSKKFSYRLIASESRRRTAVVYYCRSLETAVARPRQRNTQPPARPEFRAYFGFHAFDFYPDS